MQALECFGVIGLIQDRSVPYCNGSPTYRGVHTTRLNTNNVDYCQCYWTIHHKTIYEFGPNGLLGRIRHKMSRRTRSKRSLGAGSKSVFALTLLVPRDTVSVKPCIMIILSVKLLRREEKDSIPEQTLLNYAEKRMHVRT